MPCGGGYSNGSRVRQRRGKPICAAALWQNIAAWVENLVVKVRHVDAHVPKSWATEENQNNQQADQAAKIEVAQVDLDWQHKGELFIAQHKGCKVGSDSLGSSFNSVDNQLMQTDIRSSKKNKATKPDQSAVKELTFDLRSIIHFGVIWRTVPKAAGTRLKKGDDGNLMEFYKDKCEILHLWWNNPMQLYGLGSQVPGKELYRKGLEGPGIHNILPGILVTMNTGDIQNRFVSYPGPKRLCIAVVHTLCFDLMTFSHDTEKSLQQFMGSLDQDNALKDLVDHVQ
ncbi:hypothetical protein QYF61_009606, partial [Mycteria americana]